MGTRIDGNETWKDLLRFRPRFFILPSILVLVLIEIIIYFIMKISGALGKEFGLHFFTLYLVLTAIVAISTFDKIWRLQNQYLDKVHLRYPLSVDDADRCIKGYLSKYGATKEGMVLPDHFEHLWSSDESYEYLVDGHPILVEIRELGESLEVFVGPSPEAPDPWFDEFVASLDKALGSCLQGP